MKFWNRYITVYGLPYNPSSFKTMTEQQRTEHHGELGGDKRVEKCSICKGIIENRATLETCFHSYCFPCIKSWGDNPNRRSLCPRCDKPFQNILYNIKGDVTFDIYIVPECEYTLEPPKAEIPVETECSICFGDFVDRASVESCLHSFCFKCITDWAKVRTLCPICNGPFNLVYHNVKENLTYEEYEVPNIEKLVYCLCNYI